MNWDDGTEGTFTKCVDNPKWEEWLIQRMVMLPFKGAWTCWNVSIEDHEDD